MLFESNLIPRPRNSPCLSDRAIMMSGGRRMKTEKRTHEEAKQAEIDALARTLGPVGAVRFLQQFEKGTGNYAADQVSSHGKSHVPTLTHKNKVRYLKQPK